MKDLLNIFWEICWGISNESLENSLRWILEGYFKRIGEEICGEILEETLEIIPKKKPGKKFQAKKPPEGFFEVFLDEISENI